MDRALPAAWRRWPVVLLAALALVPAACSRGPKTYPVNGKVVLEKGGDLKKLEGTPVEFMSTSEPNTRAYGELKGDGTFTLSTYREGVSLPGAIGGAHKVRIFIETNEDGRPKKKGSPVPAKYMSFDTSGWEVTVPHDGDVVLKIP